MKSAGGELNYSSVEREHLNLTRAAAWHFGSWRGAVEAAGIEYDDIRKYRRWSRERVIARIRELHKAGADLNWRAISTQVDPSLAAAALRIGDFATWRDAITAAGLDIENVARYRFWDEARVLAELQGAKKRGESLSSKAAQQRDQPLFCAARRRFGSWNNALQSAGIAPQRKRREDRAVAEDASVATTAKTSTAKTSTAKKSVNSDGASTRAAKIAATKTARTAASLKAATAESTAVKISAAQKETAPNAASIRAVKTEAKASVAKSAPKSGATKTSATTKNPVAKTLVAKVAGKSGATKTLVTAKASTAKALAAKVASPSSKETGAKTSPAKNAAKPIASKSAKSKTSRATKK